MMVRTVLIAHSHVSSRSDLMRRIGSIRGFDCIGQTANLVETFAEVEEKLPDAVLISSDLANLEEFEVMRALFSELDVRWLIINTGAKTKLRTSAKAKPASDLFSLPENSDSAFIETQLNGLTRNQKSKLRRSGQNRVAASGTGYKRMLLIGASTGGIDALLTVLKSFPPDCPATMIVQHTGRGFGESLTALLNRQCAADVVLAEPALTLKRGRVIIGAGSKRHLKLSEDRPVRANLHGEHLVAGHCPSVDELFNSALPLAPRVVAALLTGMGRDGAEGLKALRAKGARTFAQDQASSVVYGMPKVAWDIGAVEHQLPIDQIGPALLAAAAERSAPTLRERV